ncbi:MAG: hypothetical protein IPH37_04510 [Burkholderiales bacterium]|nr:hypothetical protein [Burkholderiales bacterium]
MSAPSKVTKTQLLKLIDDLEKKPEDKGRILGDIGITVVGAGLGVAAAGSVAAAVGATSIFGVTSVAGWLGLTVVAATPVGWILGGAAAGRSLHGIAIDPQWRHVGGQESRAFESLSRRGATCCRQRGGWQYC